MAGKPKSEKESRQQLIDWSRQYGCFDQLMKIFERYDNLLKGAKTDEERRAIQAMGIIEIDNFYTGGISQNEELYMDGVRIK